MDYLNELFSDEALAVMELQRDLLFHRIPKENIRQYVEIPIAVGRENAEKLHNRPISELCEEKQIKIRLSDGAQGMAGMTFRASITYSGNGAELTLFKNAIDDLMINANVYLLPEDRFTSQSARDMLIAHELFHFLEFSDIGDTANRTEKVEIQKLFGRRRFANIMRCGEVGAHAFAKELLGLPFFPNLTDYLYLVATGKWSEQKLVERLNYAHGLLELK